MTNSDQPTMDEVIDGEPLGWRRAALVGLGLLLMILEGFDTYSVGFVGPLLSTAWKVPASQMGLIFTSGIIGSATAYLAIGPVADRQGRRRPVIVATFCMGVASLLTTLSTGAGAFTAWRVLTGLALGAALPNIVALCAEYAPSRVRALAITILYSGFGIGAALGGMIAARIVPVYGWQAVFLIGGAGPLALGVAMLILLPESARYLASRPGRAPQAAVALTAMFPRSRAAALARIDGPAAGSSRSPVAALFAVDRRAKTLAIWAVLGLNGAITAILTFWLTSFFDKMGVPRPPSLAFSVWMLIGGVTGAYAAGFLMDRVGSIVILLLFQAIACVSIVVTALTLGAPEPMLGYGLGLSLIGGTTGAQSVLANLYPTAIRATGIGWGNSIGRFTGIVAPLLVGILSQFGLRPQSTILACLLPALGALAGLVVLRSRYGQRSAVVKGLTRAIE